MGNQFKSVAIISSLKTLLFIFNLLFWVTGLVFLAVSLWAEYDLNKYIELSVDFSYTATQLIVSLAAFILFISSAAFCCIIKGESLYLYVYGGFLVCIFMIDFGICASVVCYRNTFSNSLNIGLTKTVKSFDRYKENLDLLQSTLQCCGVSNYTDWITLSPERMIPKSCCVDASQCVTANYNDVYQTGCFEVISEYLSANINTLLGFAIGMTIFPLITAILACSLATYNKKSKYDDTA